MTVSVNNKLSQIMQYILAILTVVCLRSFLSTNNDICLHSKIELGWLLTS